MTEKDIQPVSKVLRVAWNSIHLLVTAFVIFGLAFIMGRTILTGGLKGGDSAMHVGYATWLSLYFPDIPHWFPLQGGGESLLHGYPLLSHIFVVLLHRISSISILQAFRLLSFLSIPLTAMGIYFYCWVAFKKQLVGLIAAVFYLLAPLSWTWMYDWGFFSFSLAMVFLPATLICFDRYMFVVLQKPSSGSRRLWLVGVCLFLSLASLTHLSVGAGAVAFFILYIAFFSLVNESGARSRILKKGLVAILLIGVVVGLLLAFYLVPFYRYGQVANREGLNLLALHQIPQIPALEFFGLKPINPRFVLTRMSFPLIVTVFFGISILLSARSSRKVFALILGALLSTIYSLVPFFSYSLRNISSSLAMVFGLRSTLVVAMFLFPIGAAYGAFAAANTVTSRILHVWKRTSTKETNHWSWFSLRDVGISCLALIMVVILSLWLGGIYAIQPYIVSYGPTNYVDLRDIWEIKADDPCTADVQDSRTISLCNLSEARARLNIQEFLEECISLKNEGLIGPKLCSDMEPSQDSVIAFLEECEGVGNSEGEMRPCNARVYSLANQLELDNWLSFWLDDYDPIIAASQNLASILPGDPLLRIDISSYHGRLAQDFTTYSNTSQIQSYTQQLSLIHLMWGYQLGVFYFEEHGSSTMLNDLADWLGINYVLLDPTRDPIEKYQDANWIKIYEGLAYTNRNITVWKYPESKPLATHSINPSILVIGSPSKGVYPQVFGLANQGVAPYGEFLITEGKERIDQYSIDEIKAFDILFLHGYEYKSGSKAWDLLYQYVEGGGSLFIDTGWQFQVPEWEFTDAPQVLPVKKLSWTSYGKENTYELLDNDIAGDIDVTQFDPLIWEQDAWSVSGASSDDLKDWAQGVLLVQGHPLIAAGELGDGRVVWSGMNLISHLITYDNEEEKRLLHNLLDWLSYNRKGNELTPPLVRRDHPDEVHFSFNGQAENITWLYWREAYYPNWHAYLYDEAGEREIPIYRGGPGFMLMPIETSSNEVSVTLKWELSFIESASIIVSILGLLILFGIAIDGLFLGGQGLTWIKIAFAVRLPKPFLDEETHRGAEKKPLRVIDILPRTDQDVLASEKETFDTNAYETQLSDEEEEALMKSWLNDKDNEDDPWVSKMLDPDQRK